MVDLPYTRNGPRCDAALRELTAGTLPRRSRFQGEMANSEETMLYTASRLTGATIAASDGEIGSLDDLLFDDADWTVRWVVVDTGGWLAGRKVLLPPSCIGNPEDDGRRLPVSLTRQQVEDGPPSENEEALLSRRYEEKIGRASCRK